MNSYLGYGLNIHSSLPLPELLPTNNGVPDVSIKMGAVKYEPQKAGEQRAYCSMDRQEAVLFWEEYGAFLVRQGKEIIIDPRADIDMRLLRLLLLGGCLAVLLHQRGHYVMHASAVAVEDTAVAFLGPKGRGKSSTAAAFYAQGHRLLADDLVAVDMSDSRELMVVPGFPQFKLWPSSASSILDDDPETLACLADGYEKRSRKATNGYASSPLPLDCVYVLCEGDEVEVSRLSPQEAIAELIGNSYIARFGRNALHGDEAISHLRNSADIVNRVPIFRLTRPDSLQVLPSVVGKVKEHVAELRTAV